MYTIIWTEYLKDEDRTRWFCPNCHLWYSDVPYINVHLGQRHSYQHKRNYQLRMKI